MDPFAMGLGALFRGPSSVAAIYKPKDGVPAPIRVIRSQPDRLQRYAGTQFLSQENAFEIQVLDVAAPAIGDVITIVDTSFAISLLPVLDVEGLSWTCVAEVTS